MRLRFGPAAALLLLSTFSPLAAQTPPALLESPSAQTAPSLTPLEVPADLNLGGYPVLRLRGTAGGMTPEQRVSVILSRITPLLGNPTILPSNVVVYLPPEKSRYNRYPVIYVLGRRIVTVDPATVKAAGGGKTPLETATIWAKRLQQVLPRVNWRPSNAPEPKIPANPPLTVTKDFTAVGGDPAAVTLRGKVILKLHGSQLGGLTAAERADMLTARLAHLANLPAATTPDAVQVAALPTGDASLAVAGTTLISVTAQEAKAAGLANPALLAASWAKNLRAVLSPPAPVQAASPETVPSVPSAPAAPSPPSTPAAPSPPPTPAAPSPPPTPAAPSPPPTPAAPTTSSPPPSR